MNAKDPTGHKCVGEVDECLKDNGKPINGADQRTVKLDERAKELLTYGYSVDELLAMILQQEAFPAWRDDSRLKWFSGENGEPGAIFEEAASRWFWSWIKDSMVSQLYGDVETTADKNAMAVNWLVAAMQSEDGVNKEILDGYHPNLKPEFREVAREVLNPSNKEWASGNGMWSWANAYLYEQGGMNYLSEHNLYRFGNGASTWFIMDANTVNMVERFKK